MDKIEQYRRVLTSFSTLCAEGKQPSSFKAYCKAHGVEQRYMAQVLKGEYQSVRTIPGYRKVGDLCHTIYEEFKELCAQGRQPGTLKAFCHQHGITCTQMQNYLYRNKLRVIGLPGFKGPSEPLNHHCQEVPFEDVIFEEAGFLPADSGNVITVKVNGHVAVSFPADTDVAVIAKFVRKIGKEAGHVGT